MENSKSKIFIEIFIAVLVFSILIYLLYTKYSVTTVSYSGLGESYQSNEVYEVKKEIVFTDRIINSDKIEFVQRSITGGGYNPGWVISLLETQPKIFTGRVIVDDGVYQHPVTVKEEADNVFVGEMKSVDGTKQLFSLKRNIVECVDEDGNIFAYALSGMYGATSFSGCGGEVIKSVE